DFSQEAGAILEAAAVFAFAGVGGEKFVAEIAVALLDIDEIEAEFCGDAGRAMKIFDDRFDFGVGEDGKIGREFEFAVENGMAVWNFGLGIVVGVGAGVAAGMGEWQADKQAIRGAGSALVFFD